MSNSIFSRLSFSRLTSNLIRREPDAEQQLNQLYQETREQLLSSLRRMLESAQAEDVLQEAYLKLFIALKEKKAPEPRAFLFRVARNIAISRLRHQKVVEQHGIRVQLCATSATCEEALESRVSREQEQTALLAAINALPPKCRQVFVMRKIDGQTHEEIAQALGISNKTVENHLARGMRLCRAHLVAGITAQPTGNNEADQQEGTRLAVG